MLKVDICLPIKDEEEIMPKSFKQILDFIQLESQDVDWRLVAAVNGSSDSSYKIAKDFESKYPQFIKTVDIKERGKGRAIKIVWDQSEADILVFMDIDMSVQPVFLPTLINPILKQGADLVIGSRFLKDSSLERSLKREIFSRSYIYLSRLFLGHKLSDVQCGFKAIKKDLYQRIRQNLHDNEWFLDTEIVVFSNLLEAKIVEVPVSWRERGPLGKKSNIKVFKDAYKFMLKLKHLRKRLHKLRNRFNGQK